MNEDRIDFTDLANFQHRGAEIIRIADIDARDSINSTSLVAYTESGRVA